MIWVDNRTALDSGITRGGFLTCCAGQSPSDSGLGRAVGHAWYVVSAIGRRSFRLPWEGAQLTFASDGRRLSPITLDGGQHKSEYRIHLFAQQESVIRASAAPAATSASPSGRTINLISPSLPIMLTTERFRSEPYLAPILSEMLTLILGFMAGHG